MNRKEIEEGMEKIRQNNERLQIKVKELQEFLRIKNSKMMSEEENGQEIQKLKTQAELIRDKYNEILEFIDRIESIKLKK